MASQLPALFRLLSDDLRRVMLIEVALRPRGAAELAADIGVDESLILDAGRVLIEFGAIDADSSSGEIVYRPAESVSAERTPERTILRVALESGENFELDLHEP